jgi:hypothetical protein
VAKKSGKLNHGKPLRKGKSSGGRKGDIGTSMVTGEGRKTAGGKKLKA